MDPLSQTTQKITKMSPTSTSPKINFKGQKSKRVIWHKKTVSGEAHLLDFSTFSLSTLCHLEPPYPRLTFGKGELLITHAPERGITVDEAQSYNPSTLAVVDGRIEITFACFDLYRLVGVNLNVSAVSEYGGLPRAFAPMRGMRTSNF